MINDERTQQIRAVLRDERYRSGLTIDQLVLITGLPRTSIRHRLMAMADVYIHAWIYPRAAPGRPAPGRPAALYTAVFVPPDARPPEKKANRRKT